MRPIDADALVSRLKAGMEITEAFFGSAESGAAVILQAVTNEMIAQVEKEPSLVRCKECRYYYANVKYCDAWGFIFPRWEWAEEVPEDGFCMYGERIERT